MADTNHRTEIEYRSGQVFLNLVQLETEAPGKYAGLLQKAIFYSGKADTQITTYTWYIDKPFPQYYYDRLNRFTEKEMLQHVSDELFNKGLTDYIMVDAVKDGYLQNGESYHITYKDGVVTIKGKTLRINDQITYNNKLEQYIQKFESKSWYGSTRSTVKMSDILDPESGLRTKSRNNEDPSVNKDYMYDIMIAMHEEGLLDTAYQVRIRYNSLDNRLFVNEVKLEGPTADKYRSIIRKNEPGISKGKKVSLSYQKNTEKSFPPTDSRNGYSKKSLQRISEDLYKTGYQGYIIADAVHDGYIEDGEYYKVNYKKDGFFIEGVILPIEVKKRYDDKMEAFIAMHKDVKRISWSISDTFEARKGIREFRYRITNGEGEAKEQTSKKTFKTSSVTLASGPFRVYKSKGSESQMKSLVQAMHQDKLLDSNSYHVIEYRQDGVYVNARKLTGSYATKYSAMLEDMGDKRGCGAIIEYVPQGVKIPDFYSGDMKIEVNTSGINLPAIAQLMFVEGNPNFVLAHALHDGVLRERQNYIFQFSN
ncbi:MAG TPA: hypothetical protein VIN07_00735, partial [Flavipsychrobacter sp.]